MYCLLAYVECDRIHEADMQIVAAYGTALVVFGAVDAIWLSLIGNRLYRPVLADILLANLRPTPAVLFYLLFPVGIVVFVAMPAVRAGGMSAAGVYGLLFGIIAYATYDLTNYATLRNWTLQLAITDIVYGALATALASIVAVMVARLFSS
jgi:uncharacterized membrane protein